MRAALLILLSATASASSVRTVHVPATPNQIAYTQHLVGQLPSAWVINSYYAPARPNEALFETQRLLRLSASHAEVECSSYDMQSANPGALRRWTTRHTVTQSELLRAWQTPSNVRAFVAALDKVCLNANARNPESAALRLNGGAYRLPGLAGYALQPVRQDRHWTVRVTRSASPQLASRQVDNAGL